VSIDPAAPPGWLIYTTAETITIAIMAAMIAATVQGPGNRPPL
jgi:hypothetical protein